MIVLQKLIWFFTRPIVKQAVYAAIAEVIQSLVANPEVPEITKDVGKLAQKHIGEKLKVKDKSLTNP